MHSRRNVLIAGVAGATAVALGTPRAARAAAWETVLSGAFANYSTFGAAWNYRYP
jgi:galactan endo-beta-1,3-galactanase